MTSLGDPNLGVLSILEVIRERKMMKENDTGTQDLLAELNESGVILKLNRPQPRNAVSLEINASMHTALARKSIRLGNSFAQGLPANSGQVNFDGWANRDTATESVNGSKVLKIHRQVLIEWLDLVYHSLSFEAVVKSNGNSLLKWQVDGARGCEGVGI